MSAMPPGGIAPIMGPLITVERKVRSFGEYLAQLPPFFGTLDDALSYANAAKEDAERFLPNKPEEAEP